MLKGFKRFTSLMLAVIMLLSCVNFTAAAGAKPTFTVTRNGKTLTEGEDVYVGDEIEITISSSTNLTEVYVGIDANGTQYAFGGTSTGGSSCGISSGSSFDLGNSGSFIGTPTFGTPGSPMIIGASIKGYNYDVKNLGKKTSTHKYVVEDGYNGLEMLIYLSAKNAAGEDNWLVQTNPVIVPDKGSNEVTLKLTDSQGNELKDGANVANGAKVTFEVTSKYNLKSVDIYLEYNYTRTYTNLNGNKLMGTEYVLSGQTEGGTPVHKTYTASGNTFKQTLTLPSDYSYKENNMMIMVEIKSTNGDEDLIMRSLTVGTTQKTYDPIPIINPPAVPITPDIEVTVRDKNDNIVKPGGTFEGYSPMYVTVVSKNTPLRSISYSLTSGVSSGQNQATPSTAQAKPQSGSFDLGCTESAKTFMITSQDFGTSQNDMVLSITAEGPLGGLKTSLAMNFTCLSINTQLEEWLDPQIEYTFAYQDGQSIPADSEISYLVDLRFIYPNGSSTVYKANYINKLKISLIDKNNRSRIYTTNTLSCDNNNVISGIIRTPKSFDSSDFVLVLELTLNSGKVINKEVNYKAQSLVKPSTININNTYVEQKQTKTLVNGSTVTIGTPITSKLSVVSDDGKDTIKDLNIYYKNESGKTITLFLSSSVEKKEYTYQCDTALAAGNYTLYINGTTKNGTPINSETKFKLENAGSITITCDKDDNAVINAATNVTFVATAASGETIEKFDITVTDLDTNKQIDSKTYSPKVNKSTIQYQINRVGKFKIDVIAFDSLGQTQTLSRKITYSLANVPIQGNIDVSLNKSSIKAGDEVVATIKSSNELLTIKEVSYVIKNASGKQVLTNTKTCAADTTKVTVTHKTDANYKDNSMTIVYTIVTNDGQKLDIEKSISVQVSTDAEKQKQLEEGTTIDTSKDEVGKGQDININIKSTDPNIKYKKIKYTFYDKDGKVIYTKEITEISSGVTDEEITFEVPKDYKDDQLKYQLELTDTNGVTVTKEDILTILQNTELDNEIIKKVYQGVLNKQGSGVAIELWKTNSNIFYQSGDEINLVGYYYNFDNTNYDNSKLIVKLPKGVTVKAVSHGDDKLDYTKTSDGIEVDLKTIGSNKLCEIDIDLKVTSSVEYEKPQLIISEIDYGNGKKDKSSIYTYFYKEGQKGTNKSYITGYPDGSFKPENNITREEVATMIARAFEFSNGNTNTKFSDVNSSNWAYTYVMQCASRGIITGYPNGTFKPKDNITRAELYAMIFRALGMDVDDEEAIFVNKDYANGNKWETKYRAELERFGMLDDFASTDGSVKATRAEVVSLIQKVLFRNSQSVQISNFDDVNTKHWAMDDIASASQTYDYQRNNKGKEIKK